MWRDGGWGEDAQVGSEGPKDRRPRESRPSAGRTSGGVTASAPSPACSARKESPLICVTLAAASPWNGSEHRAGQRSFSEGCPCAKRVREGRSVHEDPRTAAEMVPHG